MPIVIWQFLSFRFAIVIQCLVEKDTDIFHALTAFPTYDTQGWWWIAYLISGIYGSLLINFILEHNFLSTKLKKMHLIR